MANGYGADDFPNLMGDYAKLGYVVPSMSSSPTNSGSRPDSFSLKNFISEIGKDGRRLSKGYYFFVQLSFGSIPSPMSNDREISRLLSFLCSATNLPGWRADTQSVSIYGLKYEVVSKINKTHYG